jgi:hypothetical protein
MKIDLGQYSEQEVISTTTQKELTLSKDSTVIIFQMFSKNIYSNPIGSVVREITSNCFDSHVEAKKNIPNWENAPVVIRKHKDEATNVHYISFIDFGVGMSPERIDTIFSVYFASTKRVDNEQIGGFGLGSKVPLAYKRSTGFGEGEYDNSYEIITKSNGIKYVYLVHESKKCPCINLMHQEPTTDKNGTEVRIPVLEKDLDSFQKEMIRQLYYFENIIFDGFEYKKRYSEEIVNPLPNDYQIIRGKSFLFRGNDCNDYIHVCLGRVAYPIDYRTLGLNSSDYHLPIAIKLEIGDVDVTVSRESIDYSESTIKMLKNKLEVVKAEIIDLINKQYCDIVTLEQYFQATTGFGKLYFPNGASMNVENVFKLKNVDFAKFKYNFMKMPDDKQLFKLLFNAQTMGMKPVTSRRERYKFNGGYKTLKTNKNLYYVEIDFQRNILKNSYLKEQHTTYYIISKNLISSLMLNNICDMFNVHVDYFVDEHGNKNPFIQSLHDLQDEYFEIVRNNCMNYDDFVVPEWFLAQRKRGSEITHELMKSTIPVKFMSDMSRDRVKLKTLFDYNMPIFYGTTEDNYKLIDAVKLYEILFNKNPIVNNCNYNGVLKTPSNAKNSIMFIQLSTANIKYMKYCKKARHINDFFVTMLQRKNDYVNNNIQYLEIFKIYNQLNHFYCNGLINQISKKWGSKVDAVKDFLKTNKKNDILISNKYLLEKYFKLNLTPTKEERLMLDIVNEILILQNNNNKILKHFIVPRNVNEMENELITILQATMKL